LAQYAKVDKKATTQSNIYFWLVKYIDWSMWFAISRFWLFMVSFHVCMDTLEGIKFQEKSSNTSIYMVMFQ
jgi:hypothetical protein